MRQWRSVAIGIEYSIGSGLPIFLLLNQTLILGGVLDRCPIQAVGGELQKRGNGRRACSGNELKALQQLAQASAIGATIVCNQMDLGRPLTITPAAAPNGLDKLIRARGWRENHRNLGSLWEALIQFGPTRDLLVGNKDDIGLTWCVDGLVISITKFESLSVFICPVGTIHESGHFFKIHACYRCLFRGERRYGIATLWKSPDG